MLLGTRKEQQRLETSGWICASMPSSGLVSSRESKKIAGEGLPPTSLSQSVTILLTCIGTGLHLNCNRNRDLQRLRNRFRKQQYSCMRICFTKKGLSEFDKTKELRNPEWTIMHTRLIKLLCISIETKLDRTINSAKQILQLKQETYRPWRSSEYQSP